MSTTERRTCEHCAAVLSRLNPGDLCSVCQRAVNDAMVTAQGAEELRHATDLTVQATGLRRAPAAAERAVVPHRHTGPRVTKIAEDAEPVEWRRAQAGRAVMVEETCDCTNPRYELLRMGGVRLIQRSFSSGSHLSPDVRETELMRASDADALWRSLLTGKAF